MYKKLKNKKSKIIFSFILLFALNLTSIPFFFSPVTKSTDNFKELKSSGVYYDVVINDLPGSLTNWNWAMTQPWFGGGSGVSDEPYIIQNHIFEYSTGIGYCLRIINSRKYFIINNCTFRNSGYLYAGLYLDNVTNGQIINNIMSNNYRGIRLLDTNYSSIEENNIHDNSDDGMHIYDNYHNNFHKNNITLNGDGFELDSCQFNTISENIIYDNLFEGLELNINCHFNTIFDNNINLNHDFGIELDDCNNNTFFNNIIKNSDEDGVNLNSGSEDNLFYNNYFSDNIGDNAYDDGSDNNWNNTDIGNYYDDYIGYDMDLNGIGDTPYSISGGAGAIDYLPIWNIQGPIAIDDLPSSLNNWTWAVSQAWCSGSGTDLDPYIIEDLYIDGGSTGNCLSIVNSMKHFKIQECTLINSGSGVVNAGIFLSNVTNAVLSKNNCSNNFNGIYFEYSHNNDFSLNIVTYNSYVGIWGGYGNDNNTITENYITYSQWGIALENGNNNIVQNNIVMNMFFADGILLYGSGTNYIIDNNYIENCNVDGIRVENFDKGIISNNEIFDSGVNGLNLESSNNTLVFNNYFKNNINNAIDNGANNDWNNTLIGNYWDDYTGYDMDLDGIGDTPYDVPPGGGSMDYLPIWNIQGPIAINDLPSSLNNWTWAASQAWCNGSGTLGDPYVIEDLILDGGGLDNGIFIQNSNKHFIIRNCTIYNSGLVPYASGILLLNVTNGQIIGNNASNNEYYGIGILDSDHCLIHGNIANRNTLTGIYLGDSNNNTVSENIANENVAENGIMLGSSHENIVIGNDVNNNNQYGIYVVVSLNNTLSENTVSKNLVSNFYLELSHNNTLYKNVADGISTYGMYITDSDFNDIIECEVYNSTDTGIYGSLSEHNKFINNFLSNNQHGIYLESSSSYNDIINNEIYGDASGTGILIWNGDGNTINENIIDNCWQGIYINSAENSTLYGNVVSNNVLNGIIILSNSQNTFVSGNTAENNGLHGIYSTSGHNSTIENNMVNDNTLNGIYLEGSSDNVVYNNVIRNNTNYGISISVGSDNNLLYRNFFLVNAKHAIDNGVNNNWNFTLIGNYWDNWTSPDVSPVDGIVDFPYNISGSAGSKDYLPIAEDGPPSIIINSPSEDDLFGTSAPSFSVTIADDYLDETWYSIDGGVHIFPFTGSTGTVDQSAWDAAPDGIIALRFYASDLPGNIGTAVIHIEKDTQAPIIDITFPTTNATFGSSSPSFIVEITEPNLDSIWYSLDGGLTNFTSSNNGTIDQAAWAALGEGSVTITFYARDTLGNVGSESVDVVKELPPPGGGFLIIIIIIISAVAGVAVVAVVLFIILRRRQAGE